MAKAESLLALLRLVSPALPIGAYAGSEGLEFAVDQDWIGSEADVCDWLGGRLRHGLSRLDIPLLKRFYRAHSEGDLEALEYWEAFLWASRETAELADQDRSLGRALMRLLTDLGIERAEGLGGAGGPSYASAFALAATVWEIDLETAAHGYLFSWCESQVAAAVKLVPLGQTQGQRVLGELMEAIPAQVLIGLALQDDRIGFSEPGVAIASASHETQYARLFRS